MRLHLEGEIALFVSFIFGTIVGSFLGVCIERILAGGSVLWPPSHCPSCKRELRPAELVPLVSFLFLRGRCKKCKAPIGWSLFFVELASGILALGLYWKLGWGWELLWSGLLMALLVVIAEIDRREFWIPDFLSLSGLAVGLAASFWRPLGFTGALMGAAVGLPLYIIYLLYPRGMGGGDGKLLALIGAFLGWQGALLSLFLGSLYGSVVGLVLMGGGKMRRGEPIPFGPFLVLGAISWFFFDGWLVRLLPMF